MQKGILLRFGAVGLVTILAPFTLFGDVMGTTAGSSVQGTGIDDTDYASTISISFFTYCSWVIQGMTAKYPGVNFAFAGANNNNNASYPEPAGANAVGGLFTQISSSDFSISQYAPWVVNSNATTNNITGPDGANYNRGVTGQDAGGANIVVSYTPTVASDPTSVNFIQAFIQNTNNTGFTNGVIDAGAGSPFYNATAIAGSGKKKMVGTGPLPASSANPGPAVSAWLVDIPYRCENGPIPPGGTRGCLGGVDDTLLSQVQYFQTFVESNQQVCNTGGTYSISATCAGGTNSTWDILYGGVQWGYSYSNVDTPEPASVILLGTLLTLLSAGLRRHCRRSPKPDPYPEAADSRASA